jgi:two-component system cell cycle sensor histidine kinase/response regulator CckA
MNDAKKNKSQLLEEIQKLRARLRTLERAQTKHHQIEESLRQSEAEYRRIFENANDMIYTHDLVGRFTAANPAVVRTYGYSLGEFLHLDMRDVIDPAYLPVAQESVMKKLHGIPYTEPYELLTRAKDGSPVWVEVSSCLISERGRPVSIQGILRNLTERKRAEQALRRARDELEMRVQERTAELTAANIQLQREIAEHKRTEEALRESERRYRLLAENVRDVIWTTDLNLRFTYISPSTTRLRGYSVEEAMAQALENMLTPASYEVAMGTFRELPSLERAKEKDLLRSWTLELEVTRKDGSTVWTEVKTSYLRDSDGRVVGLLGVTRDITDRRLAELEKAKLQEQLHQAQKMEAIGQLAAGISHDFTNLLALILGHAEQAQRTARQDEQTREALAMIQHVGHQAMETARSLLTFSRRLPTEKKPLDLRALVSESARLLRRMLPAPVRLIVDAGRGEPVWVNADATQLRQVLLNMIINARDAMPDGGTVWVAASPETMSSSDGQQLLRARLAVRDTGQGMPPEIVPRIFEPFFTTKKRGQGTGLGLSIVHGIVQDHGGQIEVQSQADRGSTFTITLPALPDGGIEAAEGAGWADADGTAGIVLLAEEHRLLREIMVAALRSLGYQVLAAEEGQSAIETFRRYREGIRLLILDADLPGCDGMDCLQRLRAEGDRTPAILLSGAAMNESDLRADDHVHLLRKPFSMPELERLVQEVLRADRGQEKL